MKRVPPKLQPPNAKTRRNGRKKKTVALAFASPSSSQNPLEDGVLELGMKNLRK